jgi:putative hemolysin
MLVGIIFISAALLFIGGLVALEVALTESRRTFIPRSDSQITGPQVAPSQEVEVEANSSEGAVSVADFTLAARLVTLVLLLLVGGVAFDLLSSAPLSLFSNISGVSGRSAVAVFALFTGGAIVLVTSSVSLIYLIPSFIGTRYREVVLRVLIPLGRSVVRLASPCIAAARFFMRIGSSGGDGDSGGVAEEAIEEDIRSLVKEGERAGVIEEEEREMISRVFRLGDKPIASLMTPRSDVVFIDSNMNLNGALCAALESRLTWFPVRQVVDEDVLGIVSVHDIFELKLAHAGAVDSEQLSALLAKRISKAIDVPESMTALELLELFKELGAHFAVVRDEYGGVAGIATVDDVLQVVVGDLGDIDGSERSVTVRDDGSLLVDASLDVQSLFETLNWDALSDGAQGQFHSVGGFVMTSLGQVPRVGDSFEVNGFKFEVVDMDGKRIDKVLVMRRVVAQQVNVQQVDVPQGEEQQVEVRRNLAVGEGQ